MPGPTQGEYLLAANAAYNPSTAAAAGLKPLLDSSGNAVAVSMGGDLKKPQLGWS